MLAASLEPGELAGLQFLCSPCFRFRSNGGEGLSQRSRVRTYELLRVEGRGLIAHGKSHEHKGNLVGLEDATRKKTLLFLSGGIDRDLPPTFDVYGGSQLKA